VGHLDTEQGSPTGTPDAVQRDADGSRETLEALGACRWAREHGFVLPPDAPEILDYYASRSPIFMAARFDADAARKRGQQIGDGTPIHLTIPTRNPWVPLRILALGKKSSDVVRADVYLLTDTRPALFPRLHAGLSLRHSAPASAELMRDLRADKGMEWMPDGKMWLTHLTINGPAGDLSYDLAVDARGQGRPPRDLAGLAGLPLLMLGMLLWGAGTVTLARRRSV
jgi:hypothetical protein